MTRATLFAVFLGLWCGLQGAGALKGVSRGGGGTPTPHTAWSRKHDMLGTVVVGQRVPRRYFVVQGFGETNEGSGSAPFETGAHDLAMEDAGIHNFNLVTYTSILPPEAEEISFEEAQRYFHHGAVLECILSEQHGGRGDRITAGVGRMMVHVHKAGKGRPMGGFAVEYEGHALEDVAQQQLDEALDELFNRRFDADSHSKGEKRFAIKSSVVHEAFGTAIAGVCFVDYIVPVLCTDLDGGSAEQTPAEL